MSDEKTSQTSEGLGVDPMDADPNGLGPLGNMPRSLPSERAVEAFRSLPADSEYDTDSKTDSKIDQSAPEGYFELMVEVTVRLPDGTTLTYAESVQKDAPDDYDFDEATTLLDAATDVMSRRLGRR